MLGLLKRLTAKFRRDDQSWKVYGVDYFTPPDIAAEQEARRRGRRIIVTDVDDQGCAIFGYEGDAPEYVEPQAKAS